MNFSELQANQSKTQSIAIVGTGISGLACAWLLSRNHRVTVFEADARIGGHSHTVDAQFKDAKIAVDTGFIVYNEPCYPNLTRLFETLGVATAPADMSFAVSLEGGGYEYAGKDFAGLFAQPGNIFKPRFWSMMRDLLRFYREAIRRPADHGRADAGRYLAAHRYGAPFRDDHLYPMAAAIWSTPALDVGKQPAATFVRFCENHGLLRLTGRPQWRTVVGGSRAYVERLTEPYADRIEVSRPIVSVLRDGDRGRTGRRFGRPPAFRRRGHRRPCRSGAQNAGGAERGGAQAARRLSLRPQRGGSAYRRQPHAAPQSGLGRAGII